MPERTQKAAGIAAFFPCLALLLAGCGAARPAFAPAVAAVDPDPLDGALAARMIVPAAPSCTYADAPACASACQAGDAASCNNLGAIYEVGTKGAPDLAHAELLYELACTGGATAGCNNWHRLLTARSPEPPPEPLPRATPPDLDAERDPEPATETEVAAVPDESVAARCKHGDKSACLELPGIHIRGNVRIHGNVTMFGNVYLYGPDK